MEQQSQNRLLPQISFSQRKRQTKRAFLFLSTHLLYMRRWFVQTLHCVSSSICNEKETQIAATLWVPGSDTFMWTNHRDKTSNSPSFAKYQSVSKINLSFCVVSCVIRMSLYAYILRDIFSAETGAEFCRHCPGQGTVSSRYSNPESGSTGLLSYSRQIGLQGDTSGVSVKQKQVLKSEVIKERRYNAHPRCDER